MKAFNCQIVKIVLMKLWLTDYENFHFFLWHVGHIRIKYIHFFFFFFFFFFFKYFFLLLIIP